MPLRTMRSNVTTCKLQNRRRNVVTYFLEDFVVRSEGAHENNEGSLGCTAIAENPFAININLQGKCIGHKLR